MFVLTLKRGYQSLVHFNLIFCGILIIFARLNGNHPKAMPKQSA